jgi:hypothetical protein
MEVYQMIIVGTAISDTKVKVDGSFIDGSQTVTISAIAPPNPPVNVEGKDTVLYLNPVTGELFWDYVNRPLTDSEKVGQLQEQIDINAGAIDFIVMNF